MVKPVFEIDGNDFDSLEGFFTTFRDKLGATAPSRSLDAFNDVLRGGFGTPEGGFVLRWLHSARSQTALGLELTARFVEAKLQTCHRDNIASVQADLEAARRGEGQTLYDILIAIIRTHGPGGAEAEDGVELELR